MNQEIKLIKFYPKSSCWSKCAEAIILDNCFILRLILKLLIIVQLRGEERPMVTSIASKLLSSPFDLPWNHKDFMKKIFACVQKINFFKKVFFTLWRASLFITILNPSCLKSWRFLKYAALLKLNKSRNHKAQDSNIKHSFIFYMLHFCNHIFIFDKFFRFIPILSRLCLLCFLWDDGFLSCSLCLSTSLRPTLKMDPNAPRKCFIVCQSFSFFFKLA